MFELNVILNDGISSNIYIFMIHVAPWEEEVVEEENPVDALVDELLARIEAAQVTDDDDTEEEAE